MLLGNKRLVYCDTLGRDENSTYQGKLATNHRRNLLTAYGNRPLHRTGQVLPRKCGRPGNAPVGNETMWCVAGCRVTSVPGQFRVSGLQSALSHDNSTRWFVPADRY